MPSTYTIKQAQTNLPSLVREAEKGICPVITRHEKTVAYVLSAERMDALVETMEILADQSAMAAIREARSEKKPKLYALEDLKG